MFAADGKRLAGRAARYEIHLVGVFREIDGADVSLDDLGTP